MVFERKEKCMGIFLVTLKKKQNMTSVQIFMFSKLKKHWVFVSSWIKGMKS